jgi:hypothetical protein
MNYSEAVSEIEKNYTCDKTEDVPMQASLLMVQEQLNNLLGSVHLINNEFARSAVDGNVKEYNDSVLPKIKGYKEELAIVKNKYSSETFQKIPEFAHNIVCTNIINAINKQLLETCDKIILHNNLIINQNKSIKERLSIIESSIENLENRD